VAAKDFFLKRSQAQYRARMRNSLRPVNQPSAKDARFSAVYAGGSFP
jgi:hypothetical protein